MSFLLTIIGRILTKLENLLNSYKTKEICKIIGNDSFIVQSPFHISGVHNIIAGNNVNIGKNSVIMTLRAKLIIKDHFVAGPKLTIITGDHMPVVGKFIDEVSDKDKDLIDVAKQYDQNVIIEEDVWCGANVTILKGVKVGRGSIIASGAIVTRNIPPYTVVGGIPAKVIKNKWRLDEVLQHEEILYSERERKTREELSHLE